MSSEIEIDHIINVQATLPGIPGDGARRAQIYIEFVPDEVILDSYVYYSGGPNFYPTVAPAAGVLPSNIVGLLNMELVNDNILTFTDSPTVYFPNRRFKLNKQVNGYVNFTFTGTTGTIYNGVGNGRTETFSMLLRFVKYKK